MIEHRPLQALTPYGGGILLISMQRKVVTKN